MTKIFQILNGKCVGELTYLGQQYPEVYKTLEDYQKATPWPVVEAPDTVFAEWRYENGKFIEPALKEGEVYDADTGRVWNPSLVRESERKYKYQEAEAYISKANERIITGQDPDGRWEKWKQELYQYKASVRATQDGDLTKVVYPAIPEEPQ